MTGETKIDHNTFGAVEDAFSIFSLLAEKDKLERKVNIQGGDKKDD